MMKRGQARSLRCHHRTTEQGIPGGRDVHHGPLCRLAGGLGCRAHHGPDPKPRGGDSDYYLLTSAEAASNLSRFDGIRYGQRAEAEDLNQTHGRTARLRSRGSARILLKPSRRGGLGDDCTVSNACAAACEQIDQALATTDALMMPTADDSV